MMFTYAIESETVNASGLSLNAARRMATHPAVVTVTCSCGWESGGHVRVALAQDAKRRHAPRCTGVCR